VTKIKSITAREIFKRCPEVRKVLWRGEFWKDGYFVNTVSKHGNEQVIERYIKEQGKEYKLLHKDYQLCMF
jgi:REP element-mobilizing transposase RayT